MYINVYIPLSPPPRIIAIQPKRKRSSVAAENVNNNNNNNKRDGKPLAVTSVQKPICTRRTRQTCSPYLFIIFFFTIHPLQFAPRTYTRI